MKKWIETKREYKTIRNGVDITVTEEYVVNSKFNIDTVLKSLGVISIFLPLVLFVGQYWFSSKVKRNEQLSQILTNVSLDIESLKNSPFNSSQFINACENLLHKYPSEIAVFQLKDLDATYNDIAIKCLNIKLLKFLLNEAQNDLKQADQINEGIRIIHIKNQGKIRFDVKIVKDSVTSITQKIEGWISKYKVFELKYYDLYLPDIDDRTFSLMENKLLNEYKVLDSQVRIDLMDLNSYIEALRQNLSKQDEYALANNLFRNPNPNAGISKDIFRMNIVYRIRIRRLNENLTKFQKMILVNIHD